MPTPLQSILSGIRSPSSTGGLGDMFRQQALTDSQLQSQQLQRQGMEQQMQLRANADQRQQKQFSQEQAIGASRYINYLGKQLLNTPENQWSSILEPNLPQLQELGYTPEILNNMTREQIAGVVAQTEPVIQQDQRRLKQGKTANIQDFEYYQKIKKTDPEAATMFAKDVGLLPHDRQLSSTGEKELIETQNKFHELTTQAREYELLADDFERFAGTSAGVAGKFKAFLKDVTGSQDEESELRRRFSKVRLSEALKYLPPGPATDRDVAEAFKGVPKDNVGDEQVMAFLRGSSKLSKIDAEFQEFKQDYLSQNDSTKGLIKAWKEAINNGDIESVNSLSPANKSPSSVSSSISDAELFSKYGIE